MIFLCLELCCTAVCQGDEEIYIALLTAATTNRCQLVYNTDLPLI